MARERLGKPDLESHGMNKLVQSREVCLGIDYAIKESI